MSTTLEILHLSKAERKKKSILAIKNGVTIVDEFDDLAWAVVKQAILDIGYIDKTKVYRNDGSFHYNIDRSSDSRSNIKTGGLVHWAEVLGLEYGYLMKILRYYKLI